VNATAKGVFSTEDRLLIGAQATEGAKSAGELLVVVEKNSPKPLYPKETPDGQHRGGTIEADCCSIYAML
jgi:hypothetical protein